jgi:hypothetical protein
MLAAPTPDVHIEVHYKPARPSLSDRIELEVTLKGAAPGVILAASDIPPACVAVESVRESGSSRIYTLDPIQPGPCRIPPFHTRCTDAGRPGCDIASAETELPIGTVVQPPPDIRDQDEDPVPVPQPHPASPWWWALLVLPVAAIAFLAVRKWRRNPAVRAGRRLKRAKPDSFDELHSAFRDYLADRLSLNARTRTSPELLEALRPIGPLPELEAFLTACDRARFSGTPTSDFDEARENCGETIRALEKLFKGKKTRSRAGV